MRICCDTTFLIDLFKGRRKAETAYNELMARKVRLHTTFLNVGELLAGAYLLPAEKRDQSAQEIWNMTSGFSILGVDRSSMNNVCEEYAALHHRLAARGTDIPATDKVIIAIGLAHDIRAFLTRDVNHFRRVPGIDVIGY